MVNSTYFIDWMKWDISSTPSFLERTMLWSMNFDIIAQLHDIRCGVATCLWEIKDAIPQLVERCLLWVVRGSWLIGMFWELGWHPQFLHYESLIFIITHDFKLLFNHESTALSVPQQSDGWIREALFSWFHVCQDSVLNLLSGAYGFGMENPWAISLGIHVSGLRIGLSYLSIVMVSRHDLLQ